MVFNPDEFQKVAGEKVSEDRFREVELAIAFKQLTCARCDHSAVYKYQVQQIRRRNEILQTEDEEIRWDHRFIWESIPRYAEVAETIRCRQCDEVLGLDTACIY
jgi:formylmethanofuran dehydrogenase subunit E